jgi:hypothetical protein
MRLKKLRLRLHNGLRFGGLLFARLPLLATSNLRIVRSGSMRIISLGYHDVNDDPPEGSFRPGLALYTLAPRLPLVLESTRSEGDETANLFGWIDYQS